MIRKFSPARFLFLLILICFTAWSAHLFAQTNPSRIREARPHNSITNHQPVEKPVDEETKLEKKDVPLSVSAIIQFIVITILLVGIIVWVTIIWLKKKLRERQLAEEEAMLAFQENLEQEFLSGAAPAEKISKEPVPVSPISPIGPTSPVSPIRPVKPVDQPETARPPVPSIEGIIGRLKEFGVFVSEEGPYKLLDPSGKCILVSLKKDKKALIVPRFESEYFVNQALNRFDYVYMISNEGRVLVLSKIEDYLAARWDM